METETVTIKQSDELVVDIPSKFGFKPGEKVSVKMTEDGFTISKLASIEVEMDDKMFLSVAKLAHEKDLTFNEMCNIIIKEQLDKLDKKKLPEYDPQTGDRNPYYEEDPDYPLGLS